MAGGSKRQRGRQRTLEQSDTKVPVQVERFVERHPEIVAQLIQQRTYFSGPIPEPDTLARYNDVMPGLGERIVAMAEREQTHRHDVDDKLIRVFSRGQWLGFTLGLVALLAGGYLSILGHEGFGIAAFIGSVAVIAGSLLFGRRGKKAVA